jgi:GDPmannose 4,6-dehydratase
MTKQTALILGISGQDGSYLAQLLLNKGYAVFGTSRDIQRAHTENLRQLGIHDQVKLLSVSITDFRSVLNAITLSRPDEIYNLTGQSSVALSFEQPVETFESITVGTLNLLECIRLINRPIKLYNACSSDCFGNTGDSPADEHTPFRPRSPYAVSKSAAFWEVANYREAYRIFAWSGILFNHESPLRPVRFVTQKIVSAACRIAEGSGEMLELGDISIRRDWGWAPDYVDAIWRMLQQSDPDDYVIATGTTSSLQDFVEIVFSSLGLDWRKYVVLSPSLQRPTEILVSRANPAKAYSRLGWKATFTLTDIAAQMIAAFRNGSSAHSVYQGRP